MTESRPLISAIIPVYNGERFLAEAIESVLAQRHRPLEIIVIDDGSTDATAEVASRFKGSIQYAYQPNSGPPAARNRGLNMARGAVIGFLDADDLWPENKLEAQLSRLQEDPSVEIVIGFKKVVKVGKLIEDKHEADNLMDPHVNLSLGCALIRSSVFDAIGFFDETLHYCDDWDWFMRARELGVSMSLHRDVTLIARRHEHNLTNRTDVANRYALRMLKKSLDRRRQQGRMPATSLPKLTDFEESSAR